MTSRESSNESLYFPVVEIDSRTPTLTPYSKTLLNNIRGENHRHVPNYQQKWTKTSTSNFFLNHDLISVTEKNQINLLTLFVQM